MVIIFTAMGMIPMAMTTKGELLCGVLLLETCFIAVIYSLRLLVEGWLKETAHLPNMRFYLR